MILRLLRWFYKPTNFTSQDDYRLEILHYIQNGPFLNGRESIEATLDKEDKQRHDLVEQDPQSCIKILTDLISSPNFHDELSNYAFHRQNGLDHEISILLGICADLDPQNFTAIVVPLLSDHQQRPLLMDAIGFSNSPHRTQWLSKFFDKVNELSDDEAATLVCAIGENSENRVEESRRILQKIRATTPHGRTEVHNEIDLFLPPIEN